MNDAELRGYVRARAHAAVRAAAVRAVARRALPAADEDAFIRRALERTVLAVIRHFDSPPVVTIPLPHVPVRSAA